MVPLVSRRSPDVTLSSTGDIGKSGETSGDQGAGNIGRPCVAHRRTTLWPPDVPLSFPRVLLSVPFSFHFLSSWFLSPFSFPFPFPSFLVPVSYPSFLLFSFTFLTFYFNVSFMIYLPFSVIFLSVFIPFSSPPSAPPLSSLLSFSFFLISRSCHSLCDHFPFMCHVPAVYFPLFLLQTSFSLR